MLHIIIIILIDCAKVTGTVKAVSTIADMTTTLIAAERVSAVRVNVTKSSVLVILALVNIFTDTHV